VLVSFTFSRTQHEHSQQAMIGSACRQPQLVPLFASAPRDRGGLALKPRQLSGPLAFSGAAFLVYAAVGYPRFQRRYGILAALLVSP
jgi:hypothetical protein